MFVNHLLQYNIIMNAIYTDLHVSIVYTAAL